MSKKDWEQLHAAASIGSGVVTLHGITSKRWRDFHTVCAAVLAVCIIAKM